MSIAKKWILIVSLNAVLGILFSNAYRNSYSLFGMMAGIITWCIIYIAIDTYLQKNGLHTISRRLTLSALIRAPLQFTLIPDILAGALAIDTANKLKFIYLGAQSLNHHLDFITAYLTTFFTGFYLSLICVAIYGLITLFIHIKSLIAQ